MSDVKKSLSVVAGWVSVKTPVTQSDPHSNISWLVFNAPLSQQKSYLLQICQAGKSIHHKNDTVQIKCIEIVDRNRSPFTW